MVDQHTFLQNATDNPADGSNVWNIGHGGDFTFYLETTGTPTGGSLVLETAVQPHFTGTWAPIGPATITPLPNGVTIVQLEGALFCIRARLTAPVSSPITVHGLVDY